MSIGIYGGTFNPIHMGHTLAAEYIRDFFDFEKILFIPSGVPALKDDIKTTKFDRLNMVRLATENNPFFEVSDMEIKKEKKSYTIDTIMDLKKIYNQKLYFLLGQDAAIDFDKWHRYEELLSIISFVIVNRDDNIQEDIIKKYEYLNPNFLFIDTPLIEISSTDIRYRINNKKSVKYMLDDKVYEYIIKNNLYQGV